MDTILLEGEAYLVVTFTFVWIEVGHFLFQLMGNGVVFACWGYFVRIIDKLAKEGTTVFLLYRADYGRLAKDRMK